MLLTSERFAIVFHNKNFLGLGRYRLDKAHALRNRYTVDPLVKVMVASIATIGRHWIFVDCPQDCQELRK
jgi:hypothetical protein